MTRRKTIFTFDLDDTVSDNEKENGHDFNIVAIGESLCARLETL